MLTTSPREEQVIDSSAMRTLVETIRHHRRWIVATVLIVLAATLVAYMLMPRRFVAHANVWLDHGFGDQIAAGDAGSSANSPVLRNTEIRVLTSADVAGKVVDALGLAAVRGVGQPKEGPEVSREAGRQRAVATLREGIEVESTGTSYAVAVGYTATDPVLATGILNQLVDSYVADRRSGGPRGRVRAELRDRVAQAREEVIRGESGLDGYREAVRLIGGRDGDRRLRAELSALDAEVASAARSQAAAEGLLRSVPGEDAGQAIGAARLRSLRVEQSRLIADRGQIARNYGQPQSELLTINARLAEIERELGAEARRPGRLRSEARDARNRTALIRSVRARTAAELAATEQASNRIGRLDQRVAAARERHAGLLRQLREAMASQRTDRGSAYVISHAMVPTRRDSPNPWIFALGGLLAALAAAAVVVLVLELIEKGFRTRRQFERKLGVPVIGMVPDLAKVADADLPADDPMGPPDFLYNNERSSFSAAFRAIHTGLRLGGSARSPRSIAICSALPEEGKTTVAICLARSAALAGLRVVLVDCDGRRPAASRAMAAYVEVGIVEVLEGTVDLKQALLRDTPSGAWFLAHSTGRDATTGVIGSEAMATLIETLSREFDLVLLDTPPALALVEAREVAAMADGVLLVARWRKTPIEATRIAYDLLGQAGAKVTAAALTLVDP